MSTPHASPATDHHDRPERAFGPEKVILAYDLRQRLRTQPVRERLADL